MSEWFVFVDSGDHIGPVTTDLLARGIAAGRVPRSARIARGAPSGWLDVMDVPEVVEALDILANGGTVPEAPSTQPDMTDVMSRDEFDFAQALKAKVPSGPPKPPLPPQSKAPLPAAEARVPPPPAVPPPPPGPPPGANGHGATALVPMRPRSSSAPPPPPPPMQSAPPPPAPFASPPASVEKKEEKQDVLDPRLKFLVPLGTFGIFVVFSIFVVLYALVAK